MSVHGYGISGFSRAAPMSSAGSVLQNFEEAVGPFKQSVIALDSGELARAVLGRLTRFNDAVVIDPSEGILPYFDKMGLPRDLKAQLMPLHCYIKTVINHEEVKRLKERMKEVAEELVSHIQVTFQSYEDLLALAEQLEMASKKEQALKALYSAALKALETSSLEKLAEVIAKIKASYPNMRGLSLQERTNLFSQMMILKLSGQLEQSKQELVNTRTKLNEVQQALEATKQDFVANEQKLSEEKGKVAKAQNAIQQLVRETKLLKEVVVANKEMEQIGFGPNNWLRYFGEVGQVPPLPSTIDDFLKEPCPYWEGKLVRDTHILTLMPTAVDGRPFSLTLLEELIRRPKGGRYSLQNGYRQYLPELKSQLGSISPGSAYWFLITKDIVPDSRLKVYEEQLPLLQEKRRAPKALEVMTAILMHYVATGERLYTNKPRWSFTRCEESLADDYVIVGGFEPRGPIAWNLELNKRDCTSRNRHIGIAGVKRFNS